MGELHVFHAGVDFRSYPFKEINILLNPVEDGANNNLIEKSKQLLKTTKSTNVILDSGGNTIFNRERSDKRTKCDQTNPIKCGEEINLTPFHVVDIARQLQPTAVVSLDSPLQHRKSQLESEKEFKKKLKINIEWAKETIELANKFCPDVSILIPIQARTLEQLEIFMEELQNHPFTGVSIPYRNMKPSQLVLFLIRIHQFGIPWVHILGTTCFSYLAIAAYFTRHGLFDIVSVDSMTWKQSSKYSGFLSPHDLCSHQIDDETIIPETAQKDCNCPFCRNITFDKMKHSVYSDRNLFLCSHNAMVTEQVAEQLYKNSGSIDQLEHYTMHKRSGDWKVSQAIEALYVADQLKDENIYAIEALLE